MRRQLAALMRRLADSLAPVPLESVPAPCVPATTDEDERFEQQLAELQRVQLGNILFQALHKHSHASTVQAQEN